MSPLNEYLPQNENMFSQLNPCMLTLFNRWKFVQQFSNKFNLLINHTKMKTLYAMRYLYIIGNIRLFSNRIKKYLSV